MNKQNRNLDEEYFNDINTLLWGDSDIEEEADSMSESIEEVSQ